MAGAWFVQVGGKVHGPFDGAKLRALAAAGKILPTTAVSVAATGPWGRAESVRGLFVQRPPAPPGPSVPPPVPALDAAMNPVPGPAAVAGGTGAVGPVLPSVAVIEPRPDGKKTGGMKTVWSVVGVVLGLVIFAGSLFYNLVWLRSDAAAINLIKRSMQSHFAKDDSMPKPVKVLKIELKGEGPERSGTATVKFGETTRSFPFLARVETSSGGLKVHWSSDQVPVLTSPPAPSPQRPAAPASRPGPSPAPAGRNDPADLAAQYQESLQSWLVTAADLQTLETQWGDENAVFSPAERSQIVGKLLQAWADLEAHSRAMRSLLERAPNGGGSQADEAGRKIVAILTTIESTAPALKRSLTGILASSNEAEIRAHETTYWTMSESVGAAIEGLVE